jgi:hypothetical protein
MRCFKTLLSFWRAPLHSGNVITIGGTTKYGRAGPDGRLSHGGFSDKIGWWRLTISKLALKAPMASALEATID